MSTITSANSIFSLLIPGVYNSAQTIQGYATDDAFLVEAIEKVEGRMGIDGKASYGYIFNLYLQTLTLQGDSASFDVFNNWQLAMDSGREVIPATASIIHPSIGYKYELTNGVMTSWKPMPDAKKTLQTLPFRISWENIVGAKVAS